MRRFFGAVLISIFATANFAIGFSDVDSEAVNFLIDEKVLNDGEKFFPESQISRADFVKFALRNRDEFLDGQILLEPFDDIFPSQKFAPYVAKAWQIGAIEFRRGDGEKFWPLKSIRKIDALKILLKIEGIATPNFGFEIPDFTDIKSDDRGMIAKILELNLIHPEKENFFGAQNYLKNLEAAEIFYKLRLSSKHKIYEKSPRIQIRIENQRTDQDIFDYVWQSLHKTYLHADKLNDKDLMQKSIKSLVNAVGDKFTTFFTRDETQSFLAPMDGDIEGIGAHVQLDPENRGVLIAAPLRDSPAEKAGLKSGDVILSADEFELAGKTLEEAVAKIKGPAGSTVKLEILRGENILKFEVVRAKIELKSVTARRKNNFLILEISSFGVKTPTEFIRAIDENFTKSTAGIIVDLRSNPGGAVDSVAEILEYFFEPETIGFYFRETSSETPTFLRGKGELKNVPLAVLQNEFSASASEIFAGAVRDHDRGLILGTKSFGKGTAQQMIQFRDGSSFKVTFAEWLTPDKKCVDHVGVEPDIFSELEEEKLVELAIENLRRGYGSPGNFFVKKLHAEAEKVE